MKRPPHHFVVEVRRQRRSTNGNGKSWLEDPRFAAATTQGFAVGAAAVFEPQSKPIHGPPPPARPQGRILPSLVEPVAPIRLEAAEPPPRKRRVSTPTAAKARARTNGEAVAPEPALPEAAEQPVRPRAGRTKKAQAAPREAPPRHDGAAVKALAEALAARAIKDLRPESGRDKLTQAERAEAREARHRRILERYVHGVALKPGERWKRRLQKGRE